MSFGTFDQENLLAVIAHDDSPGGCVTAASMLPAAAWDRHHRKVFDKLRSFLKRFETSPSEHLLDIIDDLCRAEPDSAKIYKSIYSSVRGTWEAGVNRDFVYGRARLFGRTHRIRSAVGEVLTLLEKPQIEEEDVVKAELVLEKAKSGNIEVMDMGISSRDPHALMNAVLEPDPPAFHIGIPELDEINAGPAVGELWLLAGKYGSGKSWGLLNAALMAAMVDEAKVLIVPLEMSAKQSAKRLLQMAFGYGIRNQRVDITRLVKDSAGRVEDFDPDVLELKSLYDESNHAELRRQIQGLRQRAEIRIRAWPSGSLTMAKLEGYLDAAHGDDGFVPDLVLLDYLQIAETSAENKRIELGQLAVDFRGMAQRRNFAAGSALQINRAGSGSNRATGQHLAEDFSAAATADRLIVYNQSDMEKQMGMARLLVDKSRNDGGNTEVLITQSYAAGAYALESALVTPSYTTMMDKLGKPDDD